MVKEFRVELADEVYWSAILTDDSPVAKRARKLMGMNNALLRAVVMAVSETTGVKNVLDVIGHLLEADEADEPKSYDVEPAIRELQMRSEKVAKEINDGESICRLWDSLPSLNDGIKEAVAELLQMVEATLMARYAVPREASVDDFLVPLLDQLQIGFQDLGKQLRRYPMFEALEALNVMEKRKPEKDVSTGFDMTRVQETISAVEK